MYRAVPGSSPRTRRKAPMVSFRLHSAVMLPGQSHAISSRLLTASPARSTKVVRMRSARSPTRAGTPPCSNCERPGHSTKGPKAMYRDLSSGSRGCTFAPRSRSLFVMNIIPGCVVHRPRLKASYDTALWMMSLCMGLPTLGRSSSQTEIAMREDTSSWLAASELEESRNLLPRNQHGRTHPQRRVADRHPL
jgi:hypothetical protein